MNRYERAHDPDRPGQLLLVGGDPVALLFWAYDFADRERTGWFLERLDGDGEPDGTPPRRIAVSADVDRLVGNTTLERAAWIARAETLELVTAAEALAAGERALAAELGGRGT